MPFKHTVHNNSPTPISIQGVSIASGSAHDVDRLTAPALTALRKGQISITTTYEALKGAELTSLLAQRYLGQNNKQFEPRAALLGTNVASQRVSNSVGKNMDDDGTFTDSSIGTDVDTAFWLIAHDIDLLNSIVAELLLRIAELEEG